MKDDKNINIFTGAIGSIADLLRDVINNLRRDNISTIIELDTSLTTLTNVNLNKIIEGGMIRSISVLDVGGGLSLQLSIGDAFTALKGDTISNEEISTLRYVGAGAGTAIIRVTGLRL